MGTKHTQSPRLRVLEEVVYYYNRQRTLHGSLCPEETDMYWPLQKQLENQFCVMQCLSNPYQPRIQSSVKQAPGVWYPLLSTFMTDHLEMRRKPTR
jgi:hypothetical protein